jgi:arsenical pump membrane protein
MGSWQQTAVQGIFWTASILTVLLILRRPYLAVRLGSRHLRMQSYFLGALLGPVLILGAGLLSYGDAVHGIAGAGSLHPGGVLALFMAMVFMSIFLDITGFFEMSARYALGCSRTDGRRLFYTIYATVSVLTVFTSNDIVILTFTPFVYYFAREARLNPTPYLVAEFFAANTWSMLLFIGNPTNILLAGASGMDFVLYLRWMALPTIAAGLTSIAMLGFVFRHEIDRPFAAPEEAKHPMDALTDRKGALAAGILMAACIILLAAAPWLGVPMWTVAVVCSLALLALLAARDSVDACLRGQMGPIRNGSTRQTFVRMPWTVVPFILSLFITVEALYRYGHTAALGRLFARFAEVVPGGVVTVYGIASTLAANLLNNIPMSLGFTFVMKDLSGPDLTGAVLATVIGSNLGANLTPLGALAGIMWMGILHDKDYRITFTQFVKYGLLVTPLTLAAALSVLAVEIGLSR